MQQYVRLKDKVSLRWGGKKKTFIPRIKKKKIAEKKRKLDPNLKIFGQQQQQQNSKDTLMEILNRETRIIFMSN